MIIREDDFASIKNDLYDYSIDLELVNNAPSNPYIQELYRFLTKNKYSKFNSLAEIMQNLASSVKKLKIFAELLKDYKFQLDEYLNDQFEANGAQGVSIRKLDHSLLFRFRSMQFLSFSCQLKQLEAINENDFDKRACTLSIIHEYLEYVMIFRSIWNINHLYEILLNGFPLDIFEEMQQKFETNFCKYNCVDLFDIAIKSREKTKIAYITRAKIFKDLKSRSEIKLDDITKLYEYKEILECLRSADTLEVVSTLIENGFPLIVLIEMLNSYPNTGGKILLNILCSRDKIINSAYLFNKEFTKSGTQKFLSENYKFVIPSLMSVAVFFAYNKDMPDSKNSFLSIVCNSNVFIDAEIETATQNIAKVFARHECADDDCVNCPGRMKHMALVSIQILRFIIAYKLQKSIDEYNTFIVCSVLITFSYMYSIFILPMTEAFLANDLLDAKQDSYNKIRQDLSPILERSESKIPEPLVLYRRLSAESQKLDALALSVTPLSNNTPAQSPANTPPVAHYYARSSLV